MPAPLAQVDGVEVGSQDPLLRVLLLLLSRVCSIVSTLRLRTVTDSPVDSLASHDAPEAPSERAWASASCASSRSRSSEIEKTVMRRLRWIGPSSRAARWMRSPAAAHCARYDKQR